MVGRDIGRVDMAIPPSSISGWYDGLKRKVQSNSRAYGMTTRTSPQVRNYILRSLPRDTYTRLLPFSQRVTLDTGEVLFEAGDRIADFYFLDSGMASLLSTTENGSTIEVGMVGYEGFVGSDLVLNCNRMPYRSMIQIAGEATRIKARPLLDEFEKNAEFRKLVLRYVHLILTQVSQSAVCNRFHTLESRFCRWLMISREITASDQIPLTQELLSQMLGVARTGVTMAAGALQQSGLIRYRRGHITILDREALADASCECYRIVTQEFDRFLKS
jgi:CRP-like cAMP-binding protein